jgi:hypothetical protein
MAGFLSLEIYRVFVFRQNTQSKYQLQQTYYNDLYKFIFIIGEKGPMYAFSHFFNYSLTITLSSTWVRIY